MRPGHIAIFLAAMEALLLIIAPLVLLLVFRKKALCWAGLLIISAGTIFAFSNSLSIKYASHIDGIGFSLTYFLGMWGLPFFVGGLFVYRPRYLPVAAIATAMLYVSSFFGPILRWDLLRTETIQASIQTLVPPLVLMALGSFYLGKNGQAQEGQMPWLYVPAAILFALILNAALIGLERASLSPPLPRLMALPLWFLPTLVLFLVGLIYLRRLKRSASWPPKPAQPES